MRRAIHGYDGCITVSARVKCTILNYMYSNLCVMHENFFSSGSSAQEGAMDCICLHSSKPMDSISGVLHISNRNNCKYIARNTKCVQSEG